MRLKIKIFGARNLNGFCRCSQSLDNTFWFRLTFLTSLSILFGNFSNRTISEHLETLVQIPRIHEKHFNETELTHSTQNNNSKLAVKKTKNNHCCMYLRHYINEVTITGEFYQQIDRQENW